jgi:oxalate decarboxylase/phosphoglucose isomerase-like protein (cupin superfamily)
MRFWLAAIPLAAVLVAQTAPEVEITAEPHHHPALENAYVRAFTVEIPPGEATLLHRHRHDYVYVNLGAAQISNQVEGKPLVTAKLQDGQTVFVEGGMAHVVRDLAATPFRNVTVEFLQDEKERAAPPPKWDEERDLHILEGGTQDIMFVKDGVRVSEIDLQPGGMMPKHHHAGPHLVVAVTDLNLQSEIVGKGVLPVALKPGEVKWVPGGFTHTLMNTGKQPAKFVTLEFH